jgi:hypothetical protein
MGLSRRKDRRSAPGPVIANTIRSYNLRTIRALGRQLHGVVAQDSSPLRARPGHREYDSLLQFAHHS